MKPFLATKYGILFVVTCACAQTTRNNVTDNAGGGGEGGDDDGGVVGTGGPGGSTGGTTSSDGGSSSGRVSSGGTSSTAGSGGDAGGSGGTAELCSMPDDCGNTDTEHCRCIAEGDTCLVGAIDADEDGYGDVRCADDALADDCDDRDKKVHPDAAEMCDGIDSDCDRLPDLEEGFALDGEALAIADPSRDQAAAWSEELGAFGIYYLGGNGPYTQRFYTVDDHGNVSAESDLGDDSTSYSVMAAGHGHFGHAFYSSGSLQFQLRTETGVADGAAQTLSSTFSGVQADVTSLPDGWLVAWREDDGDVYARTLDVGGTPNTLGATVVGEAGGTAPGPSIATSNDVIMIAFGTDEGIALRRFSAELLPLSAAVPAIADGRDPSLVAGHSGYALTWQGPGSDADTNLLYFAEIDADGDVACGPVALSTGNITPGDPIASAVSPHTDGFVVAHPNDNTGAAGAVLSRVHHGCEVRELRHYLGTSGGLKGRFSIDAGSTAFWVTWMEPSPLDGFYRRMGLDLCAPY